jgi:exopolyphosphatase/guanosine-5'-triphosphate,3'-diphosphate pyrophosphatase
MSMPIGSLSLYSKHVNDILPTDKELSKIKDSIASELKKIEMREPYQIICGVGGTVRGACKLCNGLFHIPSDNRIIDVIHMDKMLTAFTADRKYAVEKILKSFRTGYTRLSRV